MTYNPYYNLENPELLRYEYAWVNFVRNGKVVDDSIRPKILNSWRRCKENRINYLMRELPPISISSNDLSNKISLNYELLNTALPFMETLIEVVDEEGLNVQIIDKEGYLLKNLNNSNFVRDGDMVFKIGGNMDEALIGTNSSALSLTYRRPMTVVGAEHYCQILQKIACYAAPIFNNKGEILAVLNMVGQVDSMSKHTLGMVVAAAKAIENELRLKEIHSQVIKQNIEQKDILETVTDGVIYVNNRDLITQANSAMIEMLGIMKEEIIGKSVNILQTTPRLINIIDSIEEAKKIKKIIINGKNKSYNCFLNLRFISDADMTNSNRVLVFIKTEEIQDLAIQLDSKNRSFFTFDNIIGKSAILEEVIGLAKKAAEHDTRIIIEGESGTGKEMFAQAIHNSGKRANGPFVAVDCGAIPRELLESELFGYEEGAYTGAKKGGNRGKFELAHGGTLFLDEIGNMPIDMQVKLLRVLQENKLVRIGGYLSIPLDVQVIVATNTDLKKEVEKGNFREDLFYRLNIIQIKLPSLRERKSDIPILINHFIDNNRNNLYKKKIDDEVVKILMNYNWPGNVRQLHNVIERMLIMSKQDTITVESIPKDIIENIKEENIFNTEDVQPLEEVKAQYVKKVLDKYQGNIKKTAEALKVTRSTVYGIIKKNNMM